MFVPEREQQTYRELMKQQNPNNSNQNYQNPAQIESPFSFDLPNFQSNYQNSYNQQYPSFPSAYSQASSSLNRDPLPNFMPTSLAPLHLNLVQYDINDENSIPSLPRQINRRSGVDPKSFGERVQSIQMRISEIESSNTQNVEMKERVESKMIPFLTKNIATLDNELEKIVSSKIKKHVDPVLELTTHNKEKLQQMNNRYSSLINTIEHNMGERVGQFNKFKTDFQEIIDLMKRNMRETRSDVKRMHHCIDMDLQRLSELEMNDANYIEQIGKYNTMFESYDSKATNSFLNYSKSITTLISTTQTQITSEIKKLSGARNVATAALHDQAELINTRGSDSIKQCQKFINQMMEDFQESINNLSQTISSSITETQIQTDEIATIISDKIDNVISDTDTSFTLLANEIITTITNIKTNTTKNRDVIESVINSEAKNCTKNHQIIRDKFKHFNEVVDKEQKFQMDTWKTEVDKMEDETREHIRKISQTMENDLVYIEGKKKEMTRVENLVEGLENSLSIARQQVFEAIAALQTNYENITNTLAETSAIFEHSINDIDNDIIKLEEIDRSNCVKKDDIIRQNEVYVNDLEERIHFIEHQLSVALSTMSEIDKNAASVPHSIAFSPAAITIQNLAENSNQDPQTIVLFPNEPIIDIPTQISKMESEDQKINEIKEKQKQQFEDDFISQTPTTERSHISEKSFSNSENGLDNSDQKVNQTNELNQRFEDDFITLSPKTPKETNESVTNSTEAFESSENITYE